MNKTKYWP